MKIPMKKTLLFLLLILLPLWGMATVNLATYYQTIDGKSGDALATALNKKINSHTNVGYNGLWNVYKTSDVDANGYIWDIYSKGCNFRPGGKQCGNYSNVCDCYNREHSVPKSWFNEKAPAYSDAFHLYPTDGKVNGMRSNFAYGECGSNTSDALNDKHALGKLGSSTFSGYTGFKVFEPDNQYKGDLARSYFYMVTCYANFDFTNGDGSKHFKYTNGKASLTDYSIKLLMKWHRQDPVSDKEKDRNEAIYGTQHNRNPFIDFPELAEYLWGNKKGQKVNLAALLGDTDPGDTDSGDTETGVEDVFEDGTPVEIYNLLGQRLDVTTDLRSLPAGIYILRQGIHTKKVCVK